MVAGKEVELYEFIILAQLMYGPAHGYLIAKIINDMIGPDTVNTMPLTTIESFREHGKVRLSIEDQLSEAKTQLAALADVGIHYDQVTRQLQDEGVQKFADSFHTLFQCIDNKRLSSP